MSTLIENAAKVTAARAALKAAIAAKGVAVPEGTRLSEMPALVEQIDTSVETNYNRASFSGDAEKTIVVPKVLVVDLTNATDLINCFSGCSSLVSLTLPSGFGQAATDLSGCFSGCSSLTTISGNPNFKVSLDLSSCTQLQHDSLMNIINGLQTVTTSQTLKLGETNLSKLTDEEKKVATDKGWTLA